MSQTVRTNLALFTAIFTFAASICGGVWAVSQRDADLSYMKGEVKQLKQDWREDHDSVSEIRGDVKFIKETMMEWRRSTRL